MENRNESWQRLGKGKQDIEAQIFAKEILNTPLHVICPPNHDQTTEPRDSLHREIFLSPLRTTMYQTMVYQIARPYRVMCFQLPLNRRL